MRDATSVTEPELCVSIRSPHRSEGRSLQYSNRTIVTFYVSIRSPHRSEGRWVIRT